MILEEAENLIDHLLEELKDTENKIAENVRKRNEILLTIEKKFDMMYEDIKTSINGYIIDSVNNVIRIYKDGLRTTMDINSVDFEIIVNHLNTLADKKLLELRMERIKELEINLAKNKKILKNF